MLWSERCFRIVVWCIWIYFLFSCTIHYFLFSCSHDRTMQDIVYKLVPGLQEGKSVEALCSGQRLYCSLLVPALSPMLLSHGFLHCCLLWGLMFWPEGCIAICWPLLWAPCFLAVDSHIIAFSASSSSGVYSCGQFGALGLKQDRLVLQLKSYVQSHLSEHCREAHSINALGAEVLLFLSDLSPLQYG